MIINKSIAYVLKYSALPLVFLVLFWGGLKDAPVEIIAIIILFFTVIELSFIPHDMGKINEDETHLHVYETRPNPIAAEFSGGRGTKVTRYYSQTGLFFAKLLKVLYWFLIFGIFVYIYLLVKNP